MNSFNRSRSTVLSKWKPVMFTARRRYFNPHVSAFLRFHCPDGTADESRDLAFWSTGSFAYGDNCFRQASGKLLISAQLVHGMVKSILRTPTPPIDNIFALNFTFNSNSTLNYNARRRWLTNVIFRNRQIRLSRFVVEERCLPESTRGDNTRTELISRFLNEASSFVSWATASHYQRNKESVLNSVHFFVARYQEEISLNQ